MMSTQFSKGPTFGLSAEVRNKLAQKYDPETEDALSMWIYEVTGRAIPDNFMEGLKDGVILCELINKLQPGSVHTINHSTLNWHKLENIAQFVRAIGEYGLKPHDIFEANDLFEDMNHTQVQSTLVTLAGMAKTKGFHTKNDVGVKYADKKQRKFTPDKMKEGNSFISQQMGSNKFASQKGMTSYGTRRHLYDPNIGMEKPADRSTINLQMGTNKCASMAGMFALGTARQVTEKNVSLEPVDTLNVSLQMGTNKVPSQSGLTPMGGSRLVYDQKYCVKSNEVNVPVAHFGDCINKICILIGQPLLAFISHTGAPAEMGGLHGSFRPVLQTAASQDLLVSGLLNVLYDKSLPVGGDTYTLTLQFSIFAQEGNNSAPLGLCAVEMVLVVNAVGNMSEQISFKELLKAFGLGAVALVLGVEWFDWLIRRLRVRGPLKEVLFFPSPHACLEHLFTPIRSFPCTCPLPHGRETSFSRLLRHLLSACASLDLCVFSFSHMELCRAVLLLHERGVTVRVVTDRDYMTITGTQIGTLRRAGICVRHEMSTAVHMHHKFAIVDGKKLISGSLNWTLTAVQSNKENIIVTEEPELVRPYRQEFQQLWEANDPAKHTHQVTNGQLS